MLNRSTSCQLYVIHEVFRPRGRERERRIKREIVKYCFTCSTQRAAQCKILQVVKLHTPSLPPSLPLSLPPSLSHSLPPSLSHFISDSTMNLKAVPCNKLTTSTLLFMRSSTKSKNSGYVILPSVPVLITYSTLGSGWDGAYSFQGSYSVLSGCSLTLCSLSRIGRERYCLRME